jgi:hypothetical protein
MPFLHIFKMYVKIIYKLNQRIYTNSILGKNKCPQKSYFKCLGMIPKTLRNINVNNAVNVLEHVSEQIYKR